MPCATVRAGRRGAGGAIAVALLALHVGLVSVQLPPRCAHAAAAAPAGGRAGGQPLRLRGGKKEVKGKKIRQPRKLHQIAAVGAPARGARARVCAHGSTRPAALRASAYARAPARLPARTRATDVPIPVPRERAAQAEDSVS